MLIQIYYFMQEIVVCGLMKSSLSTVSNKINITLFWLFSEPEIFLYLLSQRFPSNWAEHSQVETPFISWHVPEFLQGFGEQGFASVNEKLFLKS